MNAASKMIGKCSFRDYRPPAAAVSRSRPANDGRIKWAIIQARRRLAGASDAPGLDAQWLMLHALGRPETAWLLANGDGRLSPQERERYQELVRRRQSGEPLAYILGYWEFYGREFKIDQSVLIPRPSTERLVEKSLPAIGELLKRKSQVSVADVGTGSGCVIITLALELARRQIPAWRLRFTATDISPAALATAKRNAHLYGLAERIQFLPGNMLEPLADQNIDLIISNPPYVPSAELDRTGWWTAQHGFESRGLLFEPRQALDGGRDGQKFIRQLKSCGRPAVIEGTGGKIHACRLK